MHLLVQSVLPFDCGIKVVGTVWPLFGTEEADPQDVGKHLFQRLPVLFVQTQQKKREHDEHHAHRCGAVSQRRSQQKEKRDADQRTASEADQLSFGEIKRDLGFDFCEVLGYAHIGHDAVLLPGV